MRGDLTILCIVMKKLTTVLSILMLGKCLGIQAQSVLIDPTESDTIHTALGIERDQLSLPYSATTIEVSPLTKARELNLINSLSGKIPGISIVRSSSGLAAPSRVILRGNRSFSGNNQPLYILDGIPIADIPSELNPDDIAEVTVLRGANAAALYGSRGQNGAILIETKTGQTGQSVSFGTRYMFTSPILRTDLQQEYGQGYGGVYDERTELAWGAKLNGEEVPHWSPSPELSGTTYPYKAWYPIMNFFQDGHELSTHLSVSGGNAQTRSYFSYTFGDAAGVVPTNELQRHNLHLRITHRFGKKLTFDAKATYIHQIINNKLREGTGFDNPMRHVYRLPPNIRPEDIRSFEYLDEQENVRQHFWRPGSNGGANPYWTIHRNLNEHKTDRGLAMLKLTYQFVPRFDLIVRSGLDRRLHNQEERYYNDTYIIAYFGRFGVERHQGLEWNSDVLLHWQQNIRKTFSINLSGGANTRVERNSGFFANTGDKLTIPNVFSLSNTQQVITGQITGNNRTVYSIYGTANMDWKKTVYLDITGRNDWSSALRSAKRSFFYPSVGLSTNLLKFFKFNETISQGWFRASWAQTGNEFAPFQTERKFLHNPGGSNGFLSPAILLPDNDLRPEQTRSLELGTNWSFVDNRINLDLTWYQSISRYQLFTSPLPIGAGAEEILTNGGAVRNRGIEMMLNLSMVKREIFQWNLIFQFGKNRNLVLEAGPYNADIVLGSASAFAKFIIEEDEPMGQIYSRGFLRDPIGRPIVWSNGTPMITSGLTVPVANFSPDWLGGMTHQFTYKQLSLQLLIDIRKGGTLLPVTNLIAAQSGLTNRTLTGRNGEMIFGHNIFEDENAIREDATRNTVKVSAQTLWLGLGGCCAPVGEAFTEDATNIRLRELIFSWEIPVGKEKDARFLSLSLVGRNVFFLMKKAVGIDPEMMLGTGNGREGYEAFAPPTARSLGVSVEVRL